MAYTARPAQANLDVDGLRRFTEEELRQIARATADMDTTTSGIQTNVATLLTRPYREVLSANRTYYVRTDGSDANNGLTNAAGGAFLTLQKAVDAVAALDMSIYQVTIQLGAGTYVGQVNFKKTIGALPPIVTGDTTTPSNIVLSNTNDLLLASGTGINWRVQGVKLTASGGGHCVRFTNNAQLTLDKADFGTASGYHMYVENYGQVLLGYAIQAYTISGGALGHMSAIFGGAIIAPYNAITLTGTPAFSVAYAILNGLSIVRVDAQTFTGSATGKRYEVNSNSDLYVAGASTTYLPGSVAGTTSTGGQYT